MQLLKTIYHKISIHPFTFVYLLLAFFLGMFDEYIIVLMIVVFHELCHLLMAYYFTFDIVEVTILPFGAYVYISDFYYQSIWKEICVVFAGPCSHIIIHLFGYYFLHGDMQVYILTYNAMIFGFNLVPIYPLDGNRLIGLIMQSVADLQKSFYIQLTISIVCLIVLTIFYLRISTAIIIIYLYFEQFRLYRFIPQYLQHYYLSNHLDSVGYAVHHKMIYLRGKNNYYMYQGKIVDEKTMRFMLIKSIK